MHLLKATFVFASRDSSIFFHGGLLQCGFSRFTYCFNLSRCFDAICEWMICGGMCWGNILVSFNFQMWLWKLSSSFCPFKFRKSKCCLLCNLYQAREAHGIQTLATERQAFQIRVHRAEKHSKIPHEHCCFCSIQYACQTIYGTETTRQGKTSFVFFSFFLFSR